MRKVYTPITHTIMIYKGIGDPKDSLNNGYKLTSMKTMPEKYSVSGNRLPTLTSKTIHQRMKTYIKAIQVNKNPGKYHGVSPVLPTLSLEFGNFVIEFGNPFDLPVQPIEMECLIRFTEQPPVDDLVNISQRRNIQAM